MCCKVASGAIDKHNSIVNAIYINMKKAKITCDVKVVRLEVNSTLEMRSENSMESDWLKSEA
jgi:hypothetical protein